MSEPRAFPLGDLPLDGGLTLTQAMIGYRSWGRLDADGRNAVLLPGHFPGPRMTWERLIGPGRVLDTERYCVLATDLFGDGLSSAPSQRGGVAFPRASILDNLRGQRKLLAALGVTRVRLVAGWSLGALQALLWSAIYPEMVCSTLALCPAAPWQPGTGAALRSLLGVLEAEQLLPGEWPGALARVQAEYTYSTAYFESGLFRDDGHASIGQAMAEWETSVRGRDPRDLQMILRGWADAARGGLDAIRARVLLVAAESDRCCAPADVIEMAAGIPGAETLILRSPFGHRAGMPGRYPEETAIIERALRDLLRSVTAPG